MRQPGQVETVLLDAGGVLLDLDYGYVRRLLESRGHLVDEESLSRAEARARKEIGRRLVGDGIPVADRWRDYFRVLMSRVAIPVPLWESLIDTLWDAHQKVGLWTVPVQGAVETVKRLKGLGLRLGVVSNAEGRVERDLHHAGFDGLFDAVVDSHVVGVEKPDPRIFRIALERLRARPETTLFLGDVPEVDVAGALAAGLVPLLLDRHGVYPDEEVPRIRSIAELPDWLSRRAQNV